MLPTLERADMVFLIPVISTPIFLPNYALAKRRETYHGNVLTDGGHGDSGGVALGVDIDDGLLLGVLNGAVINVDVDGLGMVPRGGVHTGSQGSLAMTFLWPSLIPIRKGMGAEATSSIGAGRMGTKTWCQMKGFLRRQTGEGGRGAYKEATAAWMVWESVARLLETKMIRLGIERYGGTYFSHIRAERMSIRDLMSNFSTRGASLIYGWGG